MDVFNAEVRWPLAKANSSPLWQRREHSEMQHISIPEECPEEIPFCFRVSNILILIHLAFCSLRGRFLITWMYTVGTTQGS